MLDRHISSICLKDFNTFLTIQKGLTRKKEDLLIDKI